MVGRGVVTECYPDVMTIMISSVCWRRLVTIMLRNYEADQASSPVPSPDWRGLFQHPPPQCSQAATAGGEIVTAVL